MERPRRAALYARAWLDDPEAGQMVELQLGRLREMVIEGTGPGQPFDVVLVLRNTRDSGSAGEFREYADTLRLDLVEIRTVE